MHFKHAHTLNQTVTMWSMHTLTGRKPTWFSLIFSCKKNRSLCNNTIGSSFYATQRIMTVSHYSVPHNTRISFASFPLQPSLCLNRDGGVASDTGALIAFLISSDVGASNDTSHSFYRFSHRLFDWHLIFAVWCYSSVEIIIISCFLSFIGRRWGN